VISFSVNSGLLCFVISRGGQDDDDDDDDDDGGEF
jgi:hypothetical protein